jgi:ferredoxin-NADP reductase
MTGPIDAVVEVLAAGAETSTIRSIRLTRPAGFAFRTSQAARVVLGDEARPMSIASGPERPYLEFAALRSDSAFKRAFFALAAGDEVRIMGPRGRFFLEEDAPGVLVAGGIGITPMRSMLQHAVDARLRTPLTLVYANHDPSQIAFGADVQALAHAVSGLRVLHTVSQADPGWAGRVGRVDAALLAEAAEGRPDAIFYAAGPPGFVERVLGAATSLGVPTERLRLEVFRNYEEP